MERKLIFLTRLYPTLILPKLKEHHIPIIIPIYVYAFFNSSSLYVYPFLNFLKSICLSFFHTLVKRTIVCTQIDNIVDRKAGKK